MNFKLLEELSGWSDFTPAYNSNDVDKSFVGKTYTIYSPITPKGLIDLCADTMWACSNEEYMLYSGALFFLIDNNDPSHKIKINISTDSYLDMYNQQVNMIELFNHNQDIAEWFRCNVQSDGETITSTLFLHNVPKIETDSYCSETDDSFSLKNIDIIDDRFEGKFIIAQSRYSNGGVRLSLISLDDGNIYCDITYQYEMNDDNKFKLNNNLLYIPNRIVDKVFKALRAEWIGNYGNDLNPIHLCRYDKNTLNNIPDFSEVDRVISKYNGVMDKFEKSISNTEYVKKSDLSKILSMSDGERHGLLKKMVGDCKNYLSSNKNDDTLWAKNPNCQIEIMKYLYNSFEKNPDYISIGDIEKFDSQMNESYRNFVKEEYGIDQTLIDNLYDAYIYAKLNMRDSIDKFITYSDDSYDSTTIPIQSVEDELNIHNIEIKWFKNMEQQETFSEFNPDWELANCNFGPCAYKVH